MMEAEQKIAQLQDSVRRQREIAQDALSKAKELDGLLQQVQDPEAQAALTKARDLVVQVARDLVANATSTSSSAAETFVLITDLAKK
jgi:hypothetical protein